MDSQLLYQAASLLTESSMIMSEIDKDISDEILSLADRVCTLLEESVVSDEEVNEYVAELNADLKDEEVEGYIGILVEPDEIVDNGHVDIRNLVPEDIMNTLIDIKKEVQEKLEKEKNNGG